MWMAIEGGRRALRETDGAHGRGSRGRARGRSPAGRARMAGWVSPGSRRVLRWERGGRSAGLSLCRRGRDEQLISSSAERICLGPSDDRFFEWIDLLRKLRRTICFVRLSVDSSLLLETRGAARDQSRPMSSSSCETRVAASISPSQVSTLVARGCLLPARRTPRVSRDLYRESRCPLSICSEEPED